MDRTERPYTLVEDILHGVLPTRRDDVRALFGDGGRLPRSRSHPQSK